MISAVIEQMYWSGTATSLASDGPAVRLSEGAESCFKEVSLRTRMAAGLGVAIAESRELQKFLWGHGRDDSGTTGGGNETHSNTS